MSSQDVCAEFFEVPDFLQTSRQLESEVEQEASSTFQFLLNAGSLQSTSHTPTNKALELICIENAFALDTTCYLGLLSPGCLELQEYGWALGRHESARLTDD